MVDTPQRDDALAAGRAALARGAWSEAAGLFERVLARGEAPQALEGLSWAAWWLEDVPACTSTRGVPRSARPRAGLTPHARHRVAGQPSSEAFS